MELVLDLDGSGNVWLVWKHLVRLPHMVWTSKLLSQFPELIHGSTSKRWKQACTQDWRDCLAAETGVSNTSIYAARQVHGKAVISISSGQKPTDEQDADALITNVPGCLLAVRTADCVPVFFYAPQKRACAVVHAGWKGTSQKIVQEAVKAFQHEYHIDPSEIFMATGPSICGNCYDISNVQDDRLSQFKRLFPGTSVITDTKAGNGLDLPLANKLLCLEMGVPEHQIELSGICTFEDPAWASYRRDPEELRVEIRNFIGIKNHRSTDF